MASRAALEETADRLPSFRPQRGMSRFRLPLAPRRRGLEGLPERYRLQVLLLASERMPGADPAAVAAAAGMLANRIRPPRALLARYPSTDGLDAWFRDNRDSVLAQADALIGGA